VRSDSNTHIVSKHLSYRLEQQRQQYKEQSGKLAGAILSSFGRLISRYSYSSQT
jgi:hypothetical protein